MLPYIASKFAAAGSSQGTTAELLNDNIFVNTKVTRLTVRFATTGVESPPFFPEKMYGFHPFTGKMPPL